jgi:hypothetical protein
MRIPSVVVGSVVEHAENPADDRLVGPSTADREVYRMAAGERSSIPRARENGTNPTG